MNTDKLTVVEQTTTGGPTRLKVLVRKEHRVLRIRLLWCMWKTDIIGVRAEGRYHLLRWPRRYRFGKPEGGRLWMGPLQPLSQSWCAPAGEGMYRVFLSAKTSFANSEALVLCPDKECVIEYADDTERDTQYEFIKDSLAKAAVGMEVCQDTERWVSTFVQSQPQELV